METRKRRIIGKVRSEKTGSSNLGEVPRGLWAFCDDGYYSPTARTMVLADKNKRREGILQNLPSWVTTTEGYAWPNYHFSTLGSGRLRLFGTCRCTRHGWISLYPGWDRLLLSIYTRHSMQICRWSDGDHNLALRVGSSVWVATTGLELFSPSYELWTT